MNCPSIGGTMIVHNAQRGDYCLEAALRSLAMACDEVVVVDAQSDDDTGDILEVISDAYSPKIRVVGAEWRPSPKGAWLADLTNHARSYLKSPWHFNLQADEVLSENAGDALHRAALAEQPLIVYRLNFWGDNWHLLPEGVVCSHWVFRFAKTSVPSVGDAESLSPDPNWKPAEFQIFHYGFIRSGQGFHEKSVPMQEAFFGTHDSILDRIPAEGMEVLLERHPKQELRRFEGRHPKCAHRWLSEHGYRLENA